MPVRLFVGNLPYDATEEEIRSHFSSAGNVLNVFIPIDRETGRKRGFAFVEFNDNAVAQEAIRLFNSQPFKGRPLAVNEARAREARPPMAGGAGGPGGSTYRPGGPPGGSTYRPGAPRPSTGGPRPPSTHGPSFGRGDSGSASAVDIPSRGDRPKRQFGPDAKPFRARSHKVFKPEGGKKSLKEKVGGQLYSVDDDEDSMTEQEIDNFATGLDNEEAEQNH
jgi:RNA recognition motif-containing protein